MEINLHTDRRDKAGKRTITVTVDTSDEARDILTSIGRGLTAPRKEPHIAVPESPTGLMDYCILLTPSQYAVLVALGGPGIEGAFETSEAYMVLESLGLTADEVVEALQTLRKKLLLKR